MEKSYGTWIITSLETDSPPALTALTRYVSCGAGDNGCHSRVAYSADVKANCRGWLALEDEALGSSRTRGTAGSAGEARTSSMSVACTPAA